MKLKLSIIFIIVITVITIILNSSANAQSTNCSGGSTVPRAEGLVSTPQLSGIFNTTTGTCITNESRAAFVSFKIPTYSDLKSIYYDQAKTTSLVRKEAPQNGLPSGGINIGDGVDHLFYFTGDLNINSPSDITGNQIGIIFVDGNLNINLAPSNKLSYGNKDSGLVFVVGGNVNIDKSVTDIDGVFIAQGRIYTATTASGCLTSQVLTSSPLTINGSLISLNTGSPINFCRTLADNDVPAEVINQQPKYLAVLKDIFADNLQKWSEVPGPITISQASPTPTPSPSPSPTPSPSPSPSGSPATKPTVTTGGATATQTNAGLYSTINPNGNNTTGWYLYGTTSTTTCNSLPTSSITGNIGSGTSPVNFNWVSIGGLSPGTTYYFCAAASNAGGTTYAPNVLSFVTATPSPSPTPPPPGTTIKRVFFTGTTYTGNLGGLSGADQKCQDRAAASLGGTWKAWLSDSSNSPSTRFSAVVRSTTTPVTFQLVNGTSIASSWTDLTDGNISSSINKTETGGTPTITTAMTNTKFDGTIYSTANTCLNWSDGTSTSNRQAGINYSTSASWSSGASGYCNLSRGLYCFEQ